MGKDDSSAAQKLAKCISKGEGSVYRMKAGTGIQACLNGTP